MLCYQLTKVVVMRKTVGLTQGKVNLCTFSLHHGGKVALVVSAHVDDCAVEGKPQDINDFKCVVRKFLHFAKNVSPVASTHATIYLNILKVLARFTGV